MAPAYNRTDKETILFFSAQIIYDETSMKERDKVFVIINPNASKGRGAGKVQKIKACFEEHGIHADFYLTKCENDGEKASLEACLKGYSTVVAAGGDGAVNEVVNGIMKSGTDTDIAQAVQLIARRQARKIDVGYLEGGRFPSGRYFLNGTGFGFEPAINFKAGEYRHLNGMPSYIVAFFHCLVHLPVSYKVKMTIDGRVFNLESQQISVSNGRRMGSAFILAPHAVLDDGLLDIVFSNRPVVRREVIPMVLSFFRGTQLEKCSFMQEERGREVLIESAEENMKIHTDGELVSLSAGRCLVRLLPSSLNLHYTRSSF